MAECKTILVVEDNDDFFGALRAALGDRYVILRAASAAAAHEALKTHADRIDAIVLDMWIPREDGSATERNVGLEVLLSAKGQPSHPGMAPEVQVIVVTGHQDLQNAIESQRLGSFRYVVKGTANVLQTLEKDIEAATEETMGRRIHKAIMECGRPDMLTPLPLRGTSSPCDAVAAVSAIAEQVESLPPSRQPGNGASSIESVLRQIRQIADDALSALESDRAGMA